MTNPLHGYKEDPTMSNKVMTAREYEEGVTKSVRTIGADMKMDVVFAGNQAMTDSKTVILPKQHDGKMMTKQQAVVGEGFADHETLHKLMTDFKTNGQKMHDFKANGQVLTERFAQAIEDVRIEHGGGVLFPGMPDALNHTAHWAARHFLENGYANDPAISKDFKRVGPIAVTWAGRQKMGYSSPLIEAALNTLSPDMRKTVEKWADAAMKLKTGCKGPGKFSKSVSYKGSRDGLALAEMLAAEAMQQQPEDGDGESDDGTGQGDAGSGGQGEGGQPETSNGTPQGQGQEAGQGQGGGVPTPQDKPGQQGQSADQQGSNDVTAGSQGDADAQGGGDVTHGHGGSATGDQTDLNPDDVYDPDLDGTVKELMKQGDQELEVEEYRTFSTAEDFIFEKGRVNKTVDGTVSPEHGFLTNPYGVDRYQRMLRNCSSSLSTMRRKFERAIMARTNDDYEGGRRRGKLDRRGLVRAIDGGKNIFRQRVEGDAVDTAVTILIDLSSSMKGYGNGTDPCDLAQQSAIALSEALDSTDVVLEVCGFSNNREYTDKLMGLLRAASKAGAKYSRTVPVDLFVFKSFEDRLRSSRQALGNMTGCVGGMTPDGPGMMIAWDRLKARPEQKKIMLVMADGGSGWRRTMGGPQNHTRDVVAKLESEGCYVVGVGIQSDAVQATFPKYVVVEDLDQLSKEVMSQIAKLILGERFVIDNADLLDVSNKRVA